MGYHKNEKLIGQRIKDCRNKKGISQQDLSIKTGIQNTTISAFENGKRIPGLQNIASIAQALGVTIDDLYFGDSSVSFIENAPNKGAKIVNCIYELVKEKVVLTDEIMTGYQLSADHVFLGNYSLQILNLVKTLREFFSRRDTYSDPDAFIKQYLESVANEINMIDNNKEHCVSNGPVPNGSTER